MLASADPATPIRIRQNFMSTDREWKTLRAGLRLMQDIMSQPQMRPYIAREMTPAASDADLDEHIRNTAITLHHPLGTCKMGRETDETAVVDPRLRVRGVESLRVIDASVMPDLISGNINAPATRKELRGIMWRRGLEYRPSLQWCSQSSPFFQCGPELRDQNSGDASPLKGEPAIPIGRVLTLTARTLVPAKSTRSQRCREKN